MLSDSLPMLEWQRRRRLQLSDLALGATASASAMLSDFLPVRDWQRRRDLQARGLNPSVQAIAFSKGRPAGEVEGVVVTSPGKRPAPPQPPPRGPLKGRLGAAAMIAGGAEHDRCGAQHLGAHQTRPCGRTVSRGPGRDVWAQGKVKGVPLPVRVEGTLDPPTGRAEISVSGLESRTLSLPPRIRIYTTPTGELDFELPGPIRLGPTTLLSEGTYVIGEPDRPKRTP